MQRRLIVAAAIAAAAALGADPSLAGSTYTIAKGSIKGPLTISNPPYSKVVNNGTITNGGQSGTAALTTTGSVTVINNGTISATATGTKSAKAVGISQ